ncbi:MAG TPA: hypothetical protein VJJ82_03900 [Candidatus Nanoarchaeia archaeon]|nr:hypothetical protein [Candidatus Nanoarchaeia archaeon]
MAFRCVKKLPDPSGLTPIRYECYFLFKEKDVELHIQKKGTTYEFERKQDQSELESKKQKFAITKEEFEQLKKFISDALIRDSYQI